MKIIRLKNGRINKAETIYQTALEIEGVFTLDDLKARLGRLVSMDKLMYYQSYLYRDFAYIGGGCTGTRHVLSPSHTYCHALTSSESAFPIQTEDIYTTFGMGALRLSVVSRSKDSP